MNKDTISYAINEDSPSIKTVHADGFVILVAAVLLQDSLKGEIVKIFTLERAEGSTTYHGKPSVLGHYERFVAEEEIPESCKNKIFSYPKFAPCVEIIKELGEDAFRIIHKNACKIAKDGKRA